MGLLTPVFFVGLFVLVSIFGVYLNVKNTDSIQNNNVLVATSTLGMELTTYTNDEFGYSISYPKTWEIDTQSEASSTTMFFMDPNQGNGLLRTSVVITTAHLPAPQSMETTVSNYKQALEYNKTKEEQDVLLEDYSTTFMGFLAHEFISTKLRSFDEGKTFIKRKQRWFSSQKEQHS